MSILYLKKIHIISICSVFSAFPALLSSGSGRMTGGAAEAEMPESGQEEIFFEYFLSFIPANGLIFRKAALNFSMRDYFSIVSARMKG